MPFFRDERTTDRRRESRHMHNVDVNVGVIQFALQAGHAFGSHHQVEDRVIGTSLGEDM